MTGRRTRALQELGQSLWLDNITREMLEDGVLHQYIEVLSVTGLTSNPTIFEHAITHGHEYDAGIHDKTRRGLSAEATFIELALEDLRRAADLFHPVFERTQGADGWVSMEVSPLLADRTADTIAAAATLHAQAQRPNIFVKIPGTPAGIPAIEESIFEGIPINVTLLFSREQYLAAAEAYLRGIERRLAAKRDPRVASVASLFVSRWDKTLADHVPAELRNRAGISVAGRTYRAYRELRASERWQKLAAAGGLPQRLLWASTGTKDPDASDTLYVEALAAPDTIDTMPDKTLLAFADHGHLRGTMAEDARDAEATLALLTAAGVDLDTVATQLQRDAAAAFVTSWNELLKRIADKSVTASPRL